MLVWSHKIARFFVVNRPVFFVITVLVAPVLVLIVMANSSMAATYQDGQHGQYGFVDLAYMQEDTNVMVQEADAMTQEQYYELLVTNPQLPQSLDEYRQKIHARLDQLNRMNNNAFVQQERVIVFQALNPPKSP